MTVNPNTCVKVAMDKWCLHSYYTLCPYAPDGSGRLLFAGCDLETGKGKVYISDKDGNIIDSFGENGTSPSFFHTGYWQTWGPDGKSVYYQSGTNTNPLIVKRDLATGKERIMQGDMEGAPPFGEPITSGFMGMLYAAGYGDGIYAPEKAPIPFQQRHKHGLFRFRPETGASELALSVEEVLEAHPHRDKLLKEDRRIKTLYGEQDGLTLMCYCLRWAPDGERCLFYFGNHTVRNVREEPGISYVLTADKNLKDIHIAVDLSFGRKGVHWSMHPDGKQLIGYGPRTDDPAKCALTLVNYDGSNYRNISDHASGGHPSVCPTDYHLIVTDETSTKIGRVVFIDAVTGKEVDAYSFPRENIENIPFGRSQHRICHHPVFNQDGTKVLCNTLPGKYTQLIEIDVKGRSL